MFISREDKFIFVHIPKTAGSSIHIGLKDHYNLVGEQRADPLPEIHHQGIDQILKNESAEGYRSFAFVRNPWERLLSAYTEFCAAPHRKGYPVSPPILAYNTFEEFCINFQHSDWSKDVHYRAQSPFVCVGGELKVDFIGKYENLQQDLNNIFDELSLPHMLLGHHRKTVHPHRRTAYTPRTKNIIGDFFEEDLKRFGYTF